MLSSTQVTDRGLQTADRTGAHDETLERRAIARAKTGDNDALHFLYVRYADDVRAYVAGIVKNHHDAEDVTQNLFARLTRAIGKFEHRDASFAAWIMRVARNAALDHLRTKRQIPVEDLRVDDPADHQLQRELCRDLRAAFDRLPEDQRRVLVMRHVVGLSPGQIARRLGKTEGAVHGLHHRGRGALQVTLREMEAAPVTA